VATAFAIASNADMPRAEPARAFALWCSSLATANSTAAVSVNPVACVADRAIFFITAEFAICATERGVMVPIV
jgi:hypothetical protein